MSGAPDSKQRAAALALEERKRMREVEEAILSRAPEHNLQPSLDRIQATMELLGDPQRAFPSIHLTGTNGKTSTTRMVDALLAEMGLKTGRLTSPHLHDLRERISIGGESISRERFIAAYDDIIPFIEMVDARSIGAGGPLMTYFEVIVAVAYAAFADAPIDVGVIEVGLGGSWDATNVIDAAVSVITPIGLDHQHFLGHDVMSIAREKAGIIKPDSIAVSAVQDPDVLEVLRERANEVGARLLVQDTDFEVLERRVALGGQTLHIRGAAGEYDEIFLPLFGPHQAQNAALALVAAEAFVGGLEQRLDPDVVRAAFSGTRSPGRLEIVRRSPTVIVDSAHNIDGARTLAAALPESFGFTTTVGLLAILKDKDAEEMLELFEPVFDEVVISRSTSPRSYDPEELGVLAADIFGDQRVTVIPDLPDALDHAAGIADAAGAGGAVVATGSITTAADVRMLVGVDNGS